MTPTPQEMVTLRSEAQNMNAPLPTVLTLAGMATLRNDLQP